MKICLDYIYDEMYEETLKESSIHRHLCLELSSKTLTDAYVLPNYEPWKDGKCYAGIVDNDGKYIMTSAWHEGARCDSYSFDKSTAFRKNETAIYMGVFSSCWGHAITDNLKKLWYLKTDECRRLLSNGAKLIYLTIGNEDMPQYIHKLFALAGVRLSDMVRVSDITQYNRIIIPDNSFVADNGQRYFTTEYKETIETIKSNVKYKGPLIEKIYFTRTQIKDWRDYGESSIENAFKKAGYTIISPEQHDVEEQIGMMMSCKHFAATEGSVSHNVVFCTPGTEVAIIRKVNDVNKYQMALNEVADVNATYVDAHNSIKASKEAPWGGPFYLFTNANVKRYLKQRMFQTPLWTKISWWNYKYYDVKIVKRIKKLLFIIQGI